MSDVFAAIVTGCFAVIIVVMQQRALAAATLAAKTAVENVTIAKATHKLVNSKMQVQLRLTAQALRRLATLTGDVKDDAAATFAENLSLDHDAAQARLDAQEVR